MTLEDMRKARALSQFEVAVAVGVTPPAVHKWEAGQSVPIGANIRALAKFYEVTIADIQEAIRETQQQNKS